jgi:5-enolpyruvylshikimate-3-phosphate synthase
MAFAVAGLVATDPVEVAGWSSVATSFPGFLDILAAAQGKPA